MISPETAGIDRLKTLLDLALPDAGILQDVRSALSRPVRVEESICEVALPADAPLTILYKAFFKEYWDSARAYKVEVSVGRLTEGPGIYKADYCFATIWYDINAKPINIDFQASWP